MKKTLVKITAKTMILSLAYQLVFPVYAQALTTGPSQPEVQSFEPVGTTEMVDMFTGDFTYNIPLMDVEGYPINIAYHSGVTIEQESSWVGLGWNINPGEINRGMRGLPDDFKGDTVDKYVHIEPEKNLRVGIGGNLPLEIFGFNFQQYGINASIGVGGYIAFNNYKGMSIGTDIGATVSVPFVSAGVNMGVGSQNGADIDLNANLDMSRLMNGMAGSGLNSSGGVSTGFNSRSGMKSVNLGVGTPIPGVTYTASFPIGMQNYVPVVTNPGLLQSFEFQARFGAEIYYTYPNFHFNIQSSTMSYEEDGAKAAFGYLYSEEAPNEGITDFSRHNDGYYNKSLKNLPLASMTYDVYAITGQGTGGTFRPYRNDIGSVYDPLVKSPKKNNYSAKFEGGVGNLFEVGADVTIYDNETNSGPWKRLNFRGGEPGSLYEKVFFKQGGELTYNYQQVNGLYSSDPVWLGEDMSTLYGKDKVVKGSLPAKYGNAHVYWNNNQIDRTARANLLTFLTAEEADIPEVAEYQKIRKFDKYIGGSFYNPRAPTQTDRYSSNADDTKGHHISEFTQTLADGRRYVYGIPAMNHMTREVVFGVDGSNADLSTGMVSIDKEQYGQNVFGKQNFYASTSTPAYAHSYLLTSVLSADYMDIVGDGPSDDDIGSWVKFNYTLWDDDYRWRTPYEADKAQFEQGFNSDIQDDRGSVVMGSRQQWQLRSMETKNHIAEFYVSERADGRGTTDSILTHRTKFNTALKLKQLKDSASLSFRLDSIKLYNKHDRYTNGDNATPIKTVIFQYKSTASGLCKGIPNTNVSGGGKLTLEKIYTRYGNSQKNLASPYVFTYGNHDSNRHGYNYANKDRWGYYKNNEDDTTTTNYEFPYVNQGVDDVIGDMAPYDLTEIKLPSGGKLKVTYERDDYAYVQDRRAMHMFKIAGVGNSTNMVPHTNLYENLNTVNDYVYFKRDISKENPNLTFKDNYLEGQEYLYYSFNMDITGKGKYDHIKGYAHYLDVGICPNDTTYGYVRIKKEKAGKQGSTNVHPATVYGINMARQNLSELIYPGFEEKNDVMSTLHAMMANISEFSYIKQSPVEYFIKKKQLGKRLNLPKSWIRLQTPNLAKKGGGTRVKRLALNDSWSSLTNNPTDAEYGKDYSYTIEDTKYGTISSGVASYEPMIGGDENPFKKPVKYTSGGDFILPAMEFFQEEPFGESFFPPPVVGYSKVRVSSIHVNEGRSSKSIEEQEFYTAKDFPIIIDYTNKEPLSPIKKKGLRKVHEEVKVLQGYVLQFNDMHGKPKKAANYVIKTDGTNYSEELVSSVTYNYHTQGQGKLSSLVTALYRKRGTVNDYEIGTIDLGKEVDFTVDTRESYNRSFRRNIDVNLNSVILGFLPIPVPTVFAPDKEELQIFRTMVATKVIQQYGILKSVTTFDHGAQTTVENMIYDAETGDVLLTRTNNEYQDKLYDLKYPAYWAYQGMGPAYTNVGYIEKADSLIIEDRADSTVSCANIPTYHARLFVDKANFLPGDELLLTYKVGGNTYQVKVWVLEDLNQFSNPGCISPPSAYSYPKDGSNPNIYRRVVLRALRDNSDNEVWPGLDEGDKSDNVTVKILRSGRRNRLNQNIQNVRLTANPYHGSIDDILDADNSAFDSVLAISVTEFSDSTRPYGYLMGDSLGNTSSFYDYDPYVLPVSVTNAGKKDINRYVLGHKGNYRPISEYTYIARRDYSLDHIRYDGTFNTQSYPFWNNVNNSSGERRILTRSSNIPTQYWKRMRMVTKYDVFGNALEEIDASGKYVSAQYGYNRSLPVAVTSNAQQRHVAYEGFEDYKMLIPQNLYSMYEGTYYFHSPFARDLQSVSNTGSQNNGYGQNYYLGLDTAYSGALITKETSHTGNYALKLSSAQLFSMSTWYPGELAGGIPFGQGGQNNTIKNLHMDGSKLYHISVWVKPISDSIQAISNDMAIHLNGLCTINNIEPSVNNNQIYPFKVSSGNIEGWYLIDGLIDLRGTSYCSIGLGLPGNAYYDDVRFVPVGANMKSFVYDPFTFRLMAELDENNFATFYEYDQEGLLIRVKKETDKGIMTISESRRSNVKN